MQLRIATRSPHVVAESIWSTKDGFQSTERYTTFLKMLLWLHIHHGFQAAQSLGVDAWITEERQRVQALEADVSLTPNPPFLDAPIAPSTDAAWGVLYVLNGSAMGASHLLKSGAIAPDWPCSYLQHMRDYARSGALAQFFEAMNQSEFDLDAATSSACSLFAQIAEFEQVETAHDTV